MEEERNNQPEMRKETNKNAYNWTLLVEGGAE